MTPAARRYLWHTAILTSGMALSSLFFNLLLLALGYDQQNLQLPWLGAWSLLGLMHSVPALAATLSSLPLWWMVSRYGPQRGLVGGALLAATSLLGMALWPTPVGMLAWAALGGPAAVLFHVSAAPFMMRHSGPHERARLFSLSAALMIGVAGVSNLIGGLLPGVLSAILGLPATSATIYRIIFGLAAFIALLALLPLRLPLSTSPSARPLAGRRRLRRKKSVWGTAPTAAFRATALKFMRMGLRPRQPGALLVAELRQLLYWSRYAIPFVFSPLFISCGAALLIPFLNIYFRQRFDAPDAALGLIFAAIGVATGAATLLAPWLAHHLGYMGSVVVTQALAIPCLLLLAAASNLWLAAGIALVRGALMNMASPLYEAYAMERTPEAARPLVIGLINGAFSLGYIVGPSISAQVQRDYGFGPLFAATAILYACGAAVNYMLFVKK